MGRVEAAQLERVRAAPPRSTAAPAAQPFAALLGALAVKPVTDSPEAKATRAALEQPAEKPPQTQGEVRDAASEAALAAGTAAKATAVGARAAGVLRGGKKMDAAGVAEGDLKTSEVGARSAATETDMSGVVPHGDGRAAASAEREERDGGQRQGAGGRAGGEAGLNDGSTPPQPSGADGGPHVRGNGQEPDTEAAQGTGVGANHANVADGTAGIQAGSGAASRGETPDKALQAGFTTASQSGAPSAATAGGGRGPSITTVGGVGGLTAVSTREAALQRLAAQAPGLKEGVDRQAFVAQATRGLAQALRQGDGVMTLRLTPENLGQLKMEIEVKESGVSARLEAATPAARRLLEDSQPLLRAALEARGLSVERIEVHTPPHGSSGAGPEAGTPDAGGHMQGATGDGGGGGDGGQGNAGAEAHAGGQGSGEASAEAAGTWAGEGIGMVEIGFEGTGGLVIHLNALA